MYLMAINVFMSVPSAKRFVVYVIKTMYFVMVQKKKKKK